MKAPPAQYPPGWYSDPWDRDGERWWDGVRWTGTTKPGRGRSHRLTEADARLVGILVACGLGAVGLAMVLFLSTADVWYPHTDWSYTEDFASGLGELRLLPATGHDADVDAGVLAATNSTPGSTLRIVVDSPFDAHQMTAEASLVLESGAKADTAGVTLTRKDGEEYGLLLSGLDVVSISGADGRCETALPISGPERTLRLEAWAGFMDAAASHSGPDVVWLTGYVNGKQVLDCSDEFTATWDSFFVRSGISVSTTDAYPTQVHARSFATTAHS